MLICYSLAKEVWLLTNGDLLCMLLLFFVGFNKIICFISSYWYLDLNFWIKWKCLERFQSITWIDKVFIYDCDDGEFNFRRVLPFKCRLTFGLNHNYYNLNYVQLFKRNEAHWWKRFPINLSLIRRSIKRLLFSFLIIS